jgi:hypothetical protein
MPFVEIPMPSPDSPALREFIAAWAPKDEQLRKQFVMHLCELVAGYATANCMEIIKAVLPAILEQEKLMRRHQNG